MWMLKLSAGYIRNIIPITPDIFYSFKYSINSLFYYTYKYLFTLNPIYVLNLQHIILMDLKSIIINVG